MYTRNEGGFTLLEILAGLVISVFVITVGYKLITTLTIEMREQREDMEDVLQVNAYNRLFLEDIRYAENIGVVEDGGVITIRYGVNGNEKELVYRPSGEGVYDVDYKDSKSTQPNWVKVQVEKGEKPVEYSPEDRKVKINKTIGGIIYDYGIYVRREVDE